MTYEEMKKDLPGTVRKIAGFLNIALSEDEMDAVFRHSSFTHMQQIEHKFEIGMMVPGSKPHGAMVRRGQHGKSDELLLPERFHLTGGHCSAELMRKGP